MGDNKILERKEAIKNRQSKYLGRSCLKNHNGLRYTINGNCVECVRLKYIPTGNKKGKKPDLFRQAAKEKGDVYYYNNKPCKRGHVAKRRTANGSCQECKKLMYKDVSKDYTLRSKYKITMAQYNKMFENQNGLCKLCDKVETILNKKLSVDHCHNTNRVRGLLCHNCNVGIGSLKHNSKLLRKAALYCEETK